MYGRELADVLYQRELEPYLPEEPLPVLSGNTVSAFVAHSTWYGTGPTHAADASSSDDPLGLDLSLTSLPLPTGTDHLVPTDANDPPTTAVDLSDVFSDDLIDFNSLPVASSFDPSCFDTVPFDNSAFGVDGTHGAVLLGVDAPPTAVVQLQPDSWESTLR